ncbi:hypothetical protein [Herbaspirillum sp. YR522]|uniref:hypothetical protein n=1 Tax=Herbaspirillum sp. YR522 TaxID=1144342 RepID=UPI00026FB359|nr:hypothetical protein [Herbaspirillum sp. YR522]EJN07806.1 hypothetical protein PMI40_01702 [Herbaspirillum sp. YR522]
MKISIGNICTTCARHTGHPQVEFSEVEFNDSGVYEYECKKGHHGLTVLQQHKFEVLFEIAINAIVDGYYREAISAFAASLERFYEFAIRTLMLKTTGSDVQFKAAWKEVQKQSERQLGAFIFTWTQHYKVLPLILSTNQSGLRNDAIHKGKIVTKEVAILFGDEVLQIATANLDKLKETCADEISQISVLTMRENLGKDCDRAERASFTRGGLLSASHTVAKEYRRTLAEEIKTMQGLREINAMIAVDQKVQERLNSLRLSSSPDMT